MGVSAQKENVTEDGKCFKVTRTSGRRGDHLVIRGSLADLLAGEPEIAQSAQSVQYEVVFPDGSVFRTRKHWAIELEARERVQDILAASFEEQLQGLRVTCDALRKQGLSIVTLEARISKARKLVGSLFGIGESTLADVREALAAAENELRLVQDNPRWVLLRDIMTGALWHPHIHTNNVVVKRVTEFAIRSGGRVEPLTQEWVGGYYADCLEGVTNTGEACSTDLRLTVEDFVPADLDMTDLAPERLVFSGRRGEVAAAVQYEYAEVDGVPVPIGRVTIPRAVYEAHKRRHELPVLPHDIRLHFSLTVQGEVTVKGFVGEQLDKRLRSAARGAQRGAANPNVDSWGYTRWHPVLPEQPPSWYAGRAR